jgi:hypothetical protein
MAVLLLHGVSQVHWIADEQTAARKDAHHVLGSKPEIIGGCFLIDITRLRGWRLRAIASSAEFLVGLVSGLSDDRAIPVWDSTFFPKADVSRLSQLGRPDRSGSTDRPPWLSLRCISSLVSKPTEAG